MQSTVCTFHIQVVPAFNDSRERDKHAYCRCLSCVCFDYQIPIHVIFNIILPIRLYNIDNIIAYWPSVMPADQKLPCHAYSCLCSNFSRLVEKFEPLYIPANSHALCVSLTPADQVSRFNLHLRDWKQLQTCSVACGSLR